MRDKYEYTQNRELSWLEFNRRVLEEAADERVPAYERLKFISIFTSNLDEFLMVRVGSLKNIENLKEEVKDNKSGLNAKEQLKKIFKKLPELYEQKDNIYAEVEKELRKYGIANLSAEELSKDEIKYIDTFFEKKLAPIISPFVLDTRHPFPFIPNNKINIFANISDSKGDSLMGLITIPDIADRFLFFPNSNRYMLISHVITYFIDRLFPGFTVKKTAIISVTRNADFDLEEGAEDEEDNIRLHMKKALKKRNRLSPVRLEITGSLTKNNINYLCDKLNIDEDQVLYSKSPLNMKYVFDLKDHINMIVLKKISDKPFTPQIPASIDINKSMIDQVIEKDRLLHFPFESIDPFLNLLKEASTDKSVISIKITIYRLASISKVAEYLVQAAENGKEVLCLMELRARFDEENNIDWSERLEQAGCTIIYGFEDYKVHSKICLITRYTDGGLQYITQIGTGNYNERTSRQYTDFSLMTAHPGIGRDAVNFFKNMLISKLDGNYRHLLAAPFGIKPKFLALIEEEILKAEAGLPAEIKLKCNSVTERDLIDKLAEASKKGVKITLVVRGICCIVPGIKNETENITVISVVGRFLEHHRLYIFGADNDDVYIGSADLMTRNLVKRIELCVPIYDEDVKARLVEYMEIVQKDSKKAKELKSDRSYEKVKGDGKISVQEFYMQRAIEDAKHVLPKVSRKNLNVNTEDIKDEYTIEQPEIGDSYQIEPDDIKKEYTIEQPENILDIAVDIETKDEYDLTKEVIDLEVDKIANVDVLESDLPDKNPEIKKLEKEIIIETPQTRDGFFKKMFKKLFGKKN